MNACSVPCWIVSLKIQQKSTLDTLGSEDVLEEVRQDSVNVIEQVRADICSSAPYFCARRPVKMGIHSCQLSGMAVMVSHERRDFARAQLRLIGIILKIKTALLVAETPAKEKYWDDWLYASYLR